MELNIEQIAEEITAIRATMAYMMDNMTTKDDMELILANRFSAKDGLEDVKHEDTAREFDQVGKHSIGAAMQACIHQAQTI